MIVIRIALLTAMACVAACSAGAQLTDNCESGRYIVTIHVVDKAQLQTLYRSMPHDGSHQERRKVRAFFGKDEKGEGHLYVPRLSGQNDQAALRSWGHELAHAVCGNFHAPIR